MERVSPFWESCSCFSGSISTQQQTPQVDEIPFRCTALQVAAFYGQVGFWPALAVLVFLIHDARHFLFQTGPYKSTGQTYLDLDKMFGFRGPYFRGLCFYLGPTQCLSPQIDSSRCFFVDETDQSGHFFLVIPIPGKLNLALFRVSASQLQTPCLMLKRYSSMLYLFTPMSCLLVRSTWLDFCWMRKPI